MTKKKLNLLEEIDLFLFFLSLMQQFVGLLEILFQFLMVPKEVNNWTHTQFQMLVKIYTAFMTWKLQ